jgi:aryl-alcohol dehydrogenase-like predicted oxidoreductase
MAPQSEGRANVDHLHSLGLGLAAVGRPAYITVERDRDLGAFADRSAEALRRRAHDLLTAAWDAGIRYFDAARSYGLAEEFLGSWLAAHPERRDAVTVASKWGYEYMGDWRRDAAVHERKDHAIAMLEKQWPLTLAALGSAPDVYLIHSVTPESAALDDPALIDSLRAIADGGTRVGFSTSGPRQGAVIEKALALPDSPFAVVQATWNLLEPSAGPALAAADGAGWLVVVKEALANGRLTDGADASAASVLAVADAQPLASFALGAALAQPWARVVLSGAVTTAQLDENLRARVPRIPPHRLSSLAEPAERYWRARSALGWA